jgi:AAA domain
MTVTDETAAKAVINGRKPKPRVVVDNEQPIEPSLALKLTHFDECDKAAKKVWLFKDFMAKGETSGLYGPPGVGKSAIETDIAIHVARGMDFRGFKTKGKCGVAVFAFERADLTRRRLHAYKLRDQLDDLPISVASDIINLMDPKCVDIISDTIKAHEDRYSIGCGFAVLDTAAKGIAVAGGDEDKAKDVNRCLANLRRLHQMHSIHLSLVGHTGKDETRGQRGSNAAPGDYDLHIQLSTNGDVKTATVKKANDQPEGDLLSYRMSKVVTGRDEDGDEISTWIVDKEIIRLKASEKGETKLTNNQKTMFGILFDAKRLSTDQWNEKARAIGIGTKRPATLHDLKIDLRSRGMVYHNEAADLWGIKD